MPRFLILIALLVPFLICGGSPHVASASGEHVIRVATLAPSGSVFMRDFGRVMKQVLKETNNNVRFKLYSSGVSGDEIDMLRKMRAGQLDAAMMTAEGLGLAVPEVNVLQAPGVVTTYEKLEAVQKVMYPEFDVAFEKNGFKLIGWGEAGELRMFSKSAVAQPSDIKRMRPWLSSSSPIMKEFWRVVGATPVPMGMAEVYGALQTKMVDLVESSSIAYVALLWHTSDLTHVSEETYGALVGAWLMNKRTFDQLSEHEQEVVMRLTREEGERQRPRARKMDRDTYKRLVTDNGYKLSKLSAAGKASLADISKQVRERMVGRVYPAGMLAQVQEIAGKAP